MLDFRKVLLAAAVAGLGLVSTASAQVACSGVTVTGGTPTIAVEGTTEALNPVVLGCTAAAGNSVTVVLTANVPFTNAATTTGVLVDVQATAQVAAGGPVAGPVAASTVTISGSTLTATFSLGGDTLNSFTFTGLRVNANSVPSSSVVSIATSGVAGGGITGTTTATPVANVLTSLVPSVLTPQANQTLCGVTAKGVYAVTQIVIQENFNAAFKTAAEYSVAGSTAATQGTRLAVTFNNLNANVTYYVPASVTGGGVTLAAVAAGTGSTAATTNSATVGVAGTGAGTFAATTLVPVTTTTGSATVYYNDTADTAGAIDTATILLYENVSSAAAVTSVSSSLVTASVGLVGVSTGYPQYAASTPATISPASTFVAPNQGLLSACSTTLLFPYITNLSGFDTGVSIANASTGVGTGVTPSSGSCNVSFYGTAAPTTAYSTGTISTAGSATFAASTVAPGFSGYAVATCGFLSAHGYAFVFTQGLGGLAADYLAPVLASGSTAYAPNTAVGNSPF
jgi:hypothetical protein